MAWNGFCDLQGEKAALESETGQEPVKPELSLEEKVVSAIESVEYPPAHPLAARLKTRSDRVLIPTSFPYPLRSQRLEEDGR